MGPIRTHPDRSGPIRTDSDRSGSIWTNNGPESFRTGPDTFSRTILNEYNHITEPIPDPSGPIQTYPDPNRTDPDPFGPIRTDPDRFGPIRTSGPIRVNDDPESFRTGPDPFSRTILNEYDHITEPISDPNGPIQTYPDLFRTADRSVKN